MSCSASSARPPLTITSSYRSRLNATLPPLIPPSPPEDDDEESHAHFISTAPSPITVSPPRPLISSMLTSFVLIPSRKQRNMYDLQTSRTSDVDSFSLPLPASPHHASFSVDVWQEDGHYRTGGRPTSRETLPLWSSSLSKLAPMILVAVICPLSTLLVLAAIFSLPVTTYLPHTLSELADLGHQLQAYSDSGLRPMGHVLGVLSITALWKHAWSIPGSVLLNVLAGVLLSPTMATFLMTTLTAMGSILSTLLSTPLAPIISQFFPKALTLTRTALEGGDILSKDRSPSWVRLSVLRLIGVVPWSGINIACGITGVRLFDCFLGAFIGTLPWTAVTCQIGDIMQTVATASTSSGNPETLASLLHSPTIVCKLAFLTFLSLVPILARDRLRGLLGRSAGEELADGEGKVVSDAKGLRWWWRPRRKASGGTEMDAWPVAPEKNGSLR